MGPPNDNENPPPQTIYVKAAGNGFAVAALSLGIVGTVFGTIPITSLIAIACGLVGTIFGLIALRKVKEGGRKVMSWFGLALSILALTLGIVGYIIVQDAIEDVDREFERIEQEIDNNSR